MPKKTKLQPDVLRGSDLPTDTAPKPTDPLADGPLPAVKKDPPRLNIRYYNPRTAQLLARHYLSLGADMVLALKKMRPGFREDEYQSYANQMERTPQVREAIEKELQGHGLDEASFQKFIQTVWLRFYAGSSREKDRATQVLARGFGLGDKADEMKKPAALPIKGFQEGIRNMLGDAAAGDPDAQSNPTGFGRIESVPEANVAEALADDTDEEGDDAAE